VRPGHGEYLEPLVAQRSDRFVRQGLRLGELAQAVPGRDLPQARRRHEDATCPVSDGLAGEGGEAARACLAHAGYDVPFGEV